MSTAILRTARCKLALEELAFFSKEVRVLGVYPGASLPVESQLAAE